MSFTIPPGNKIAGQSGFVTDIDNAYTALAAVAGINVKNTAYAGGAKGDGVNDDTAAIQAAVTACISAGGGVVYLPAGTYKTTSTITANFNNTAVYIRGDGRWATTIDYHGSGDCLRVYDSSTYTSRTAHGGGVTDLTIYGGNSSASVASAGLHAGDILQLELDLAVSNFNQFTGSIGAWLDSQYYQTEQLQGRIYAGACLSHVVFDNSANLSGSSNGSFERCDLSIYINQITATYDGVVLRGGTFITDGRLGIYGNFVTQTPAVSSAVLRVTGSTPVSGATNSNIANSRLDIGCELDVTVGSSAPRTIFFGAGTNNIYACYGILSFNQAGAFQASNNSSQLIFYQGTIHGDTSLASTWLLSSDGTTTSGGAIQLNPVSETHGYISIYSTTLGIPVYMVPDVNNTALAPAFGAISAQGFGIVGSTSNAGNTCFAVLNFAQTTGPGLGHATFTCLDNNTVVTFHNTLDDGSGNVIVTGNAKLAVGTTSLAPLTFQSGTNLTAAAAGVMEYDGVAFYATGDTTSGRAQIANEQKFRLTATGGTISTIANYFGTTSNISLVANAEYEIEIDCWFLKTTAGTVTWTFTNSAAPTSMTLDYQMSPATGIVTTAAATDLFGQQYNITATAPTVVSPSLTTAVNHRHKFWIRLINGTGTSLKIQATASAGTITPGINSYWKARRVPLANIGTFAA